MSELGRIRGGERGDMEALVLDAVSQPVPLHDSVVRNYFGNYSSANFQFGGAVLGLLLDTSEFRDRAQSYRNFNVAAGAWCMGPETFGRVLGYNIKADETDAVNIHAEDLVVEKAAAADFTSISVLTVIGPTQEDHASGKHTETLHPCGRCRGRLAASPLINEQTLVVTARPDFRVIQLASLAAIIAAHDSGDASGITTFRFDDTPAILQPRKWEPGSGIPQAVEEIDSTDYDATVGLHLIRRFQELRQAA